MIFFGAGQNDTEDMLEKFKDKIVKLRIFADEDGKTNLSIKDVDGEVCFAGKEKNDLAGESVQCH